MVMERQQVPLEDKWNVEALYPSFEEWEKDFKHWSGEERLPKWPQIAIFKGVLNQGPKKLRELFKGFFEIDRHLNKLFTYAHLRLDEEVTNPFHKQAFDRITSLLYDFKKENSWIEPEILAIPEKKLLEFLNAEDVKEFRVYLEQIVRLKAHTLSAEKEELIALAGKPLETSQRTFNVFNNADMKFPSITDSEGQHRELTHGKYLFYLREGDRKLREEAFKTLHRSFLNYENTLCELINGQMQRHVFDMRARGYASCLEAALFPYQIDTAVYSSLIHHTRQHLPSLHRYISMRKGQLEYDRLHIYDLHVPLVADVDMSMSYEEAEKLIVDSVGLLGEEYQEKLAKGLKQDRWVDRYENVNKRSGAYSSGCYDSMPYILMNYQGTFNDVSTLAHEAGHSMHTLLSCAHQPYQYSQYSIFVAEVASTFHEELLFRHLMTKITDKMQRGYLINQKIDHIRATFFRQVMFAEFELRLHQWVEKGVPLTPSFLKTEYRKLNEDYFGPDLVLDEELDIEWARIPHFYYNFYVYQYATGISAAHALVDKVQKEGNPAREQYLKFLSSGSSRFPLDLLSLAGVEMRGPGPVTSLIQLFDQLVQELDELGIKRLATN